VPTNLHRTGPPLHQSSLRCRSPRCIPVAAESYYQRRADAPGRSNKSRADRVRLNPATSLAPLSSSHISIRLPWQTRIRLAGGFGRAPAICRSSSTAFQTLTVPNRYTIFNSATSSLSFILSQQMRALTQERLLLKIKLALSQSHRSNIKGRCSDDAASVHHSSSQNVRFCRSIVGCASACPCPHRPSPRKSPCGIPCGMPARAPFLDPPYSERT
jgi:hypothetical protein